MQAKNYCRFRMTDGKPFKRYTDDIPPLGTEHHRLSLPLPTYFPFIYIRRDIRKDGIGGLFYVSDSLEYFFCGIIVIIGKKKRYNNDAPEDIGRFFIVSFLIIINYEQKLFLGAVGGGAADGL